MENILEKEKFDSVKELSKIQMAISDGRSELKNLQETIEKYKIFREDEANKIIDKVLKESRDALDNISQNQNELAHYREELEAYANELKSGSKTIVTLFQDFRKKIDQGQKDIEEYYKVINKIKKEIKIEQSKLDSEMKIIKIERKNLADETRLLNDRRQALERGFEELNRLKNKKNE